MILNSVHPKELQLASGIWIDGREFRGGIWSSTTALLAADSGSWWGWLVSWLVFLQEGGKSVLRAIEAGMTVLLSFTLSLSSFLSPWSPGGPPIDCWLP
jgi:hypothetical protein